MKKSFAIALLALMGLTLVATDARAGEWGLGVGVAAQQPPQPGTQDCVSRVAPLLRKRWRGHCGAVRFGDCVDLF